MAIQKGDKSTVSFINRLELGQLEPNWAPPAEFPDLTQYPEIAIDLETYDPDLTTMGPAWVREQGFIAGVAVATAGYQAYFPMRHQGGGNLDPKMVMRWLAKQVTGPATKVFHNAQYDLGWLQYEGVEVKGPVRDTMIAAPLVDENRFTYALNALGKDYVDMRKDERLLRAAATDWNVDPKAEMWKLPAKYVGGYAEQDAVLTLALWQQMKIELSKQQLEAINELEQALIQPILAMRTLGIRVDVDATERAKAMLSKQKQELIDFIKGKTGIVIEPWVNASVEAVFDEQNLAYPKVDGVSSFTKGFLGSHGHEIPRAIVKLREADKASSTFLDGIIRFEHKGRIHCQLNQLKSDEGGTVTGRVSCSTPNLQTMPSRNAEIKALIRGLFLPEEGCRWGSFDYSSQEPRLLVHYCNIMPPSMRHPAIDDIVHAFKYGDDPDFHQMVADIAGLTRKEAKPINLGIMYGMGVKKMALELGVSVEEAKVIMRKHEEAVPFVKGIADQTKKRADKYGQIRTIGGRLGRFDMYEARSFGYTKALPYDEAVNKYTQVQRAFTYRALNKLIQGSAADQTKTAMRDCVVAGHQFMLQVHDELCFNIESDAQAAEIKEIMEVGLPLSIPSAVDVALADTWGGAG